MERWEQSVKWTTAMTLRPTCHWAVGSVPTNKLLSVLGADLPHQIFWWTIFSHHTWTDQLILCDSIILWLKETRQGQIMLSSLLKYQLTSFLFLLGVG